MKKPQQKTPQQHTWSLRLRPLTVALCSASLLSLPFPVIAQVVVSGGNTKVYTAPNGVQVVDIAGANSAGVSHNKYSQFNVPANGLVLNNGDSTQIMRQSQLAGQVSANMNLANAAKVIINEVTSTSRSTLAGYTEVLGARADVIIANPYGITCSGCGFINTPRVTLTTGVPTLDGAGNLSGLRVRQGDILINGNGLDGATLDYLDLVARSVKLDGQINTRDLAIAAGNNDWDYAARSASAVAGDGGVAPDLGIDSTALGGMYANRIRLIATEQGVGVRLRGDVAASAAELTLTAAGQILVQSQLSARAGDIAVSSGAGGAAALTVSGLNAGLSAGGDIDLRSNAGGIVLGDASLNAGAALRLQAAGAVSDTASAGNRAALRFGAGAVTLQAGGAATLDGTSWGAGGDLAMTAATLAVGPSGATVYSGGNGAGGLRLSATGGDLNLNGAQVRTPGALSLSAGQGAITLAAGGTLQAGDSLALAAAGRVANAGTMLAVRDVTLASAGLSNSGQLQAGANLSANSTAGVVNTAGAALLAGGSLVLQAAALDNDGALQGSQGLTVSSGGAVTNGASGVLLTSGSGAALRLDAGSVSNAGVLQSAGALSVASMGALDNGGSMQTLSSGAGGSAGALDLHGASIGNSGMLAAAGAASMDADLAIANSGTLQSVGGLAITLGTTLDNSGKLLSASDLRIGSDAAAFTLTNSNRIEAAGLLALGGSGHVANLNNGAQGVLLGGSGQLRLGSLANSGIVQTRQSLDIRASGDIDNHANAIILTQGQAGAALTLEAANLHNDGVLQAAGQLTLQADAALVNSGQILTQGSAGGGSDGDLALRGATLSNSGKVLAAGAATITAGSTLGNSGTLQGNRGLSATVGSGLSNLSGGQILSGGDLALLGTANFSLANAGRIQAAGALDIGGAAQRANLDNEAGAILLGERIALLAGSVDNSGVLQATQDVDIAATGLAHNHRGGAILTTGAAGKNVTLTANAIVNDGTVQATGDLALSSATSLSNSVDGALLTLASGDGGDNGALRLTAGAALSNAGQVVSNGTANFAAGSVSNSGRMQSLGALAANVGSGLNNSGNVLGGSTVDIGSDAAVFGLDNSGLLQSATALTIGDAAHLAAVNNRASVVGKTVSMTGTALNNIGSDSKVLSTLGGQGDVTLVFNGGQVSNDGTLHADGHLNVSAGGIANASMAGISAIVNMSLTANGADIVNNGWIYSPGDMTLTAPGHQIRNTQSGNIEATGKLVFNTGSTGSFFNGNYIQGAGALEITTGSFVNQAGDILPTIVDLAPVWVSTTQIGDSGDFNCNAFGAQCAHSRLYNFVYTINQDYFYNGGPYAPTNNTPAKLLSSGDIKINYSTTASNTISVISGNNVVITGAAGAAAFENNDLRLQQKEISRLVWVRVDHDQIRYATTAAAYNDVLDHLNDNEAPGSWLYYGNSDSDIARSLADSGLPYSMQTGLKDQPGQTAYNAGIYARGSFGYVGPGVVLKSATAYAPSGGPAGAPNASATLVGLGGASVAGGGGANSLVQASGGGGAAASGLTTVVGAGGVTFTGPNLALPTNPNGLYLTTKDSNTSYLVETNPLFGAGGTLGSSYLAQRLGYDPATIEKRLGDANYEAKLVRDQLIAQTNNFLLSGYANEADQIKGLLDNAVGQGGALGLAFGTALTAEQAGKLTKDMVWMVETTVNGQKVLAPVVYLAADTRAKVLSGSVISANDVNIHAGSVSNTGGTIHAANALSITTVGDLTNTGGTISGNSVALSSTGGSVVNQTATQFLGTDAYGRTAVGATGTISAAQDLSITAAQDVKVIGATLAAGGNANISAGRDVVFDTIQNKTADSSAGSTSSGNVLSGSSSSWSRNEVDTKQIGSSVGAGGNLSIRSGNDVTVAGSQVSAGGDASVNAGNNLNLIDRQDVSQVSTSNQSNSHGFTASASTSGSSVGYSASSSSENTRTLVGTSVGAGITSGGNTSLAAANTVTVRGSDVAAGADLAVSARDVQVLAGQNTFEQTIDKHSSTVGVSVGVDTSAVAGAIAMGQGKPTSAADAARVVGGAWAGPQVSVGVNMSSTTSHSQQSDSAARVSTFTSGGNTSVTAQNAATFEGTQVKAGGDINVKASDINMVEARNTSSLTTQSSTSGLSISVPTDSMAAARQMAAESAISGGAGDGLTLATMSSTQRATSDTGDKGTLSSFSAGGSMTRTASNTITDQGTQIVVAKDFTQSAATIQQLAATDKTSSTVTETKNSGTLGLSIDFATAQAFNDAKAGDSSGARELAGGPTAGVDVAYQRTTSNERQDSTTARTGSVVAGGNISSTSTGTTQLQGTTLRSGGDTTLTAATLVASAAHNTQTSSSNGDTVDAKLRVAVDASAEPSGKLSGGYATSGANDAASQAVAGSIAAGGNLTVRTTGDASFEGTQLAAGKDATLQAGGNVTMTAARNTTSGSTSSTNLEGAVSASKEEVGVEFKAERANSSSASSEAVAGGVSAGNNLTISAGRNASFEGTALAGGNDTAISAGADVRMTAAQSTASASASSQSLEVKLGGKKDEKSGELEVAMSKSDSASSDAAAGSVGAGNNLSIKAGNNASFEGTGIAAGNNASIAAGGNLALLAATSSASASSTEVKVGLSGSRGEDSQTGGAALDLGLSQARSSRQTGSTVAVGGNLNLASGGSTTLQGTQADVGGVASVQAAGGLVKQDAVSSSSSSGLNLGLAAEVSGSRESKGDKKGAAATAKPAADKDEGGDAEIPDENKNRASLSLSSTSSSSRTGVAIRQGGAAVVANLPRVASVLALPEVKAAASVNAALAGPLAQYGSQAAIPDRVKRAILAEAGTPAPAGANLDSLLKQTQDAGKTAAASGLAGANISAAQQAEVLKTMGMEK